MDPLSSFEDNELLRILEQKEMEISLLENPASFLMMLKARSLISQEEYTDWDQETTKEKKEKVVYDILNNIEKKKSQEIRTFWECVFHDITRSQYPTLDKMCRDLIEGNTKKTDQGQLDQELTETNQVVQNNDEPPGLSSYQTVALKIKGKKTLPVTCGNKEGKLIRCKFSPRAKCIEANGKWFTLREFQKFGEIEGIQNWKKNIKCHGFPLEDLIKAGDLKLPKKKK